MTGHDSGGMVQGWTALHCAAYKGHMDSVDLLLQHGAKLTAQTTVVRYHNYLGSTTKLHRYNAV